MRPILVNKEWCDENSARSAISQMTVEILAWTNVTLGTSVVRTPGKLSGLRGFSVGLQALSFGGQVTIPREEGNRVYNKRCASAWHIVFNTNYPTQGFYRIWDHPVRLADLTPERFQELHELATRGLAT
jgi:hypothetical protein